MKSGEKKLRREIRSFSKTRGFIAIPLVLLGILGLVLPIIPGTLFLFIGVVLIAPSLEEKIKKWFGKNLNQTG